MKTYAQVINNVINLIGGQDVGLPLHENFLAKYADILCIDITKLELKPQVGYLYEDGAFHSPEEFEMKRAEILPPEETEAR